MLNTIAYIVCGGVIFALGGLCADFIRVRATASAQEAYTTAYAKGWEGRDSIGTSSGEAPAPLDYEPAAPIVLEMFRPRLVEKDDEDE